MPSRPACLPGGHHKNFLAGLAAAFVGFVVWITVSVIYG
jgi:hypothetical protein